MFRASLSSIFRSSESGLDEGGTAARENTGELAMIAIPRYTPLVTLLAVGYSFFLATRVARARIRFHVALPVQVYGAYP